MKRMQFKVLGKQLTLDSTGNPNYWKLTISTPDSYRTTGFYAMNLASALYHSEITALGVR